jgi:hypothetical protein
VVTVIRAARAATPAPTIHRHPEPPLRNAPGQRPPSALCEPLGGQPTAVAQDFAAFRALAARDARALDRLRTRLAVVDPVLVGQPDGDVDDVAGLVAIHRHL